QFVDRSDFPRVLLYVKETTVDSIKALVSAAKQACHDVCHLGGELVAYADFASQVPRTLIESTETSLVLVAAVLAYLAVVFGQEAQIPRLLLSSFWGTFFMVSAIAVSHVSMDFLKCVVASVLVGLTGDNAIQFLFAARRGSLRHGIESRGGASILT